MASQCDVFRLLEYEFVKFEIGKNITEDALT